MPDPREPDATPLMAEAAGHDIRLAGGRLYVDGERVPVCETEHALLALLVRERHRVVAADELCRHAFPDQDPRLYVSHMLIYLTHARRKLHCTTAGAVLVQTVWGTGFRLAPPHQPE